MARPNSTRIITDEMIEEIIDRVASGETVSSICRDKHLCCRTVFYAKITETDDLTNRYARARKLQAHALMDEAIEESRKCISVANGDPGTGEAGARVQAKKVHIDTIKFAASKLNVKDYGNKISNEISGPNGGPIKQETVDLTEHDEEEIVRIRDRREKLKDGKD